MGGQLNAGFGLHPHPNVNITVRPDLPLTLLAAPARIRVDFWHRPRSEITCWPVRYLTSFRSQTAEPGWVLQLMLYCLKIETILMI
jgi:hypothetical protein